MYSAYMILVVLVSVGFQPARAQNSFLTTIRERFTVKPRVDTTTPSGLYIPCTSLDGQMGICVPINICPYLNAANQEGIGIIDIRVGDECNYLEVCCPRKAPKTVTRFVTTTPVTTTPKKQECGRRQMDGINFQYNVKENEAQLGEFAWTVAIMSKDSQTNAVKVKRGGGSLIHPSVVLTAAHTVLKDDEYEVTAGATKSEDRRFASQTRRVASKVIHEQFIPAFALNDIALLFLEQPMSLVPNVGIVCLPKPTTVAKGGTRCVATGWDNAPTKDETGEYSGLLNKVEMPVVDRITCRRQLRKTVLGPTFVLHTSFMCAGGEEGKDVCSGYGGSPFACPIEGNSDRYEQSGILAWGVACGQADVPGVYVDVAMFRNWIDGQVTAKGFDTSYYEY